MALSRADLVSATAGELQDVLTLAAVLPTDTTGNLKESIDRTFRALGVAEADLLTATVADGGEEKALAFAAYFVIYRAVAATVSKMAVAAGSAKAELIQQHENLLRLLANALAIAQYYGLPLPGNGQSGFIPIPYAGGISVSDYRAIAEDTDRVPPLFSLDDVAIPGVDPVEWGDFRW